MNGSGTRKRTRILSIVVAFLASVWAAVSCVAPEEDADRAEVISPPESAGVPMIEMDEPTSARPVTVGAVIYPSHVSRGTEFTLLVEVRTAPSWHVYPTAGVEGYAPTRLGLELPEGVEAAEEWRVPSPTEGHDGVRSIYEGAIQFQRPLRVRPDATIGEHILECRLSYQACDPMLCRPPETQTLRVKLTIT